MIKVQMFSAPGQGLVAILLSLGMAGVLRGMAGILPGMAGVLSGMGGVLLDSAPCGPETHC